MSENQEATQRPRNVDPNARPHVDEPAPKAAAPTPLPPQLSAHLRANPTHVRSTSEDRLRKGLEPFPQIIKDDSPVPTSEEAILKGEEQAKSGGKKSSARTTDHQEAPSSPGGATAGGTTTTGGGTAARGSTSGGGT